MTHSLFKTFYKLSYISKKLFYISNRLNGILYLAITNIYDIIDALLSEINCLTFYTHKSPFLNYDMYKDIITRERKCIQLLYYISK